MEKRKIRYFTVHPSSFLFVPRRYPRRQCGGLAASETENRVTPITMIFRCKGMLLLRRAQQNADDICPFSRWPGVGGEFGHVPLLPASTRWNTRPDAPLLSVWKDENEKNGRPERGDQG